MWGGTGAYSKTKNQIESSTMLIYNHALGWAWTDTNSQPKA